MSHEVQTSFYFLSLTFVKRARARSHVFCLFLNSARNTTAKRKLWRCFLRQTLYTDEGVIPETSDNFTLKFWHSKNTFFSTYNFIRVRRSKNLFCNILVWSGLEILRFSWQFGRCSGFFRGCSGFSGECSWFSGECSWFSGGCSGFSGGCSGFSGGCSGF